MLQGCYSGNPEYSGKVAHLQHTSVLQFAVQEHWVS